MKPKQSTVKPKQSTVKPRHNTVKPKQNTVKPKQTKNLVRYIFFFIFTSHVTLNTKFTLQIEKKRQSKFLLWRKKTN